MKKDVLFIGATHGDEPIGVDVVRRLASYRDQFDLEIGNPRAFEQRVRFTEVDLNRCGTGNLQSDVFEEKRAAEIVALTQNYRYVVDIHGANNDMGTFILLTNPSKKNWQLASLFSTIDRIVVWPSITPEMQYPPSEFFPCGLEIECGKKNDADVYDNLEQILSLFLEEYDSFDLSDAAVMKRLYQKQILIMYDKLAPDSGISPNDLREFEQFTLADESFFPAFISTYPYADVLCYKLKEFSTSSLPF